MKTIELTQGKKAIVDDEDYKRLKQYKWHYDNGYAKRTLCLGKGKFKGIRMHREVIGAKEGELVDHINFDTLDNRRENLRICNRAQNRWHSRMNSDNTTGYKGVTITQNSTYRYKAQIRRNGEFIYLGVYKTKEEAWKVYIEKARELHGEFALS